jgi:type VI secretion system protein ImpF
MTPTDEPIPGLQPSVLDRLLDPRSGGTAAAPGYSLRQLMASVLRDLNDLLNTVCPLNSVPARFAETARSVAAYGVADLISAEADTKQQRDILGQVIKAAIERFEPRLKQVRVVMLSEKPDARMAVMYRIDARIAADPAPAVAFETLLELNTGKCVVTAPGGP